MKSKVERLWPHTSSESSGYAPHQPSAIGENKEVDELRASLQEQKLALAKAERRINRLIGERSQLSSLLEKRDKKIDELNRELGQFQSLKLTTGGELRGNSDVWMRIGHAFTSMFKPFKSFVSEQRGLAKRQGADSAAVDSEGSGKTPIGSRIGDGADKPVVGVLLFGLSEDQIESLLPSIERDCSSKGLRPLLLVDIDAFEIFRACNLPFEYIPPAGQRERFDTSLNWDLYLQRRLSIIRRKWNPAKLIAFGDRATWTLELWSTSPFEGTRLPGVADGSGSS